MESVKNMPHQRDIGTFLCLGCNRYWHKQIKIPLSRCFLKYENQKQLKKAVVMTPVCFFYMEGTWVTPSLLGIHISVEISFWKADTCSYHTYTLVYTPAMQNIGFKQATQKGPQTSPFKNYRKDLVLYKFGGY